MPWSISHYTYFLSDTTVILILSGLGGFVLHVLLVNKRTRNFIRNYQELKRKEKMSQELLEQQSLLQSRAKSMEDSLQYAQRIQRAMFTTQRELQCMFPDSFIYQSPKDIVSGDFYWAKQINGRVLFVVADCTGHGVPGAFMSLIGLEFFRQIVVEREILEPHQVLNEMNRYFDLVFGKEREESLKDGIDLAFCAYDYKNHVLEFSGAFNPLYIVRNSEVIQIRGDRTSVGPDFGIPRESFSTNKVDIRQDDIIYLF
jgi:serine phosphatase RsbU (regulator of sigma subunit)